MHRGGRCVQVHREQIFEDAASRRTLDGVNKRAYGGGSGVVEYCDTERGQGRRERGRRVAEARDPRPE